MTECVVLKLNGLSIGRQNDIIMVFTYVSPQYSPIYTETNPNGIEILSDKLTEITQNHPNAEIFIAGDLNARTKDFYDYIPDDNIDFVFGQDTHYPEDNFTTPRASKDCQVYNSFGLSLIDLCCTFDVHFFNGRLFSDKNGEFTCFANNGASVVDYMIASTTLFKHVTDFAVANHAFSVHCPISCKFSFTLDQTTNQLPENEDLNQWQRMKWKNDYKEKFLTKFNQLYGQFENSLINNDNSVVSMLHNFTDMILTSGTCMMINNKRRIQKLRTQPPWWNKECTRLKNMKYNNLKQFRQTNDTSDLERYKLAKTSFKNQCKREKLEYQKNCRRKLIESRKEPKQFWSYIRNTENIIDSNVSDTDNISSNGWFDYFQSLLNDDNVEDININETPNNEIQPDNDILNRPITENEIKCSIKNLHKNKSPGPDGICIEIYKHTLDTISPFLYRLFNEILESGSFPEQWSESIITPIHKKGSKADPNNYRGISLINSLCKIFVYILNVRLQNFCDENMLIDESQAGFRKGYSTIDNIFTLSALIQKYLSKSGGRFYCLYIDFAKAFDCIKHTKLLNTLNEKGISGNFLKIFKSMYSSLRACVKTNNGLTNFFKCTVGTRQGCISSPLVFSLFINELIIYLRNEINGGIFVTENIPELLALFYADDVSDFADTVIKLQRQINTIAHFCDSFDMKLNLDKTKIIVFRNGGPLRHTEKWLYKGSPIEVVSLYKYLGMYMTPKLCWSKSHEFASKQALKVSYFIYKYQFKFGHFHPYDIFKLFDSMVLPILCYGSQIWGYQYINKIERVHLAFCKKYIQLPQNSSDVFVYGECGRLPLCTIYFANCVKYWLKLITMEEYRYPRQCYNMLYRLDNVGRNNWTSNVRKLLFANGFGHAWINQGVGNEIYFIQLFKQRIKDCCFQNWTAKLDESSKADSYKGFKSLLNIENYLCIDMSSKLRRALARFRCSCHNLQIEIGRHNGVDRAFRYCPLCQKEHILVVESEMHFLLECSTYNALRDIYFLDQWKHVKTREKFNAIMSNSDNTAIIRLAKFLNSAFELRDSQI